MGNNLLLCNSSSPKVENVWRVVIPNNGRFEYSKGTARFKGNVIKTTKYNALTFLPKNLFEQFHRWANIFFICIVCINWIPVINAFAKEVAMLPVIAVLGVTMLKDGFEDWKRRLHDRVVNKLKCDVFSNVGKGYVDREWQDICVGDILHLSCNEVIPADVLLLHSSNSSGICFIETSNLDGECNLKQREVVKGFHDKVQFNPTDYTCKVECDPPNTEIYNFKGSVIYANGYKTAVTKNNLLLRGCTLRNTDYAEGIVVYAGHDTKAMLNNRGPRYKRSKLERQVNRDVIWCVVILLLLCLGGALCHGIWLSLFKDLSTVVYIGFNSDEVNPAYQGFLTFWTLIILLQVMIPLPMYVAIELVKLGQVYFINQDLELYHKLTNKPMECRALNITEDLGQIQYIFSDKTGTLTDNRMVFQSCSIGGIDFSSDDVTDTHHVDKSISSDIGISPTKTDDELEFPIDPYLQQEVATITIDEKGDRTTNSHLQRVKDFFILLAVCNTVVVSSRPHQDRTATVVDESMSESTLQFSNSVDENLLMKGADLNKNKADLSSSPNKDRRRSSLGSSISETGLCYEAESPDELALVKAAYAYGCRLVGRTATSVTIWLPAQGEVMLNILHVLHFDPIRKRMSVIIENPGTDDVILLCKGADSAILGNLAFDQDPKYEEMVKRSDRHIHDYAKVGLRTLCMAKKVINASEYQRWFEVYHKAELSMYGREEKIYEAICRIETDLTLLGATGIEDRLQEGVPETIQCLREAGLKVWVLTGDKQETAINVAYSCHLIGPDQDLIILNAKNQFEAVEMITENLRKICNVNSSSHHSIQPHCEQKKDADNNRGYALVIDGITLDYALKCANEEFLQLAEKCLSVLCCRTTPIQKAAMVSLVKEKLKALTLAIGDGANDVSMIQTADVGVGISGQEGMQAVMASDFALAQFRYLRKLLLVHGHWCYDRLARIILYMFYKSAAFVFVLFWYQIHCGFSGALAVDQYYTIFHNLLYTSIPPVIVGVFEKELPAKILLKKPQLYKAGPLCKRYQPYSFWINLLDAIWQSLVVFYVAMFMYGTSTVGMAEMGTLCISSSVICALAVIALETRSYMWMTWLTLVLSITIMWLSMIATAQFAITADPPLNPYGVFYVSVSSPLYWFGILLTVVVALLPRFIIRSLKGTIDPSESSIERQLLVERDTQIPDLDGSEESSSRHQVTPFTENSVSSNVLAKSIRKEPRTTHIVTPYRSRSMPYLNAALHDTPGGVRPSTTLQITTDAVDC